MSTPNIVSVKDKVNLPTIPCEDYTLFKQALNKLRMVDDFVVQKLNTAIPTDTFKRAESIGTKQQRCSEFCSELEIAYEGRKHAISACISKTEAQVTELRALRAKDRDDVVISEQLSDTQRRLRMMQSELVVETIVEERTTKIFKERCSSFEVLQR